MYDWKGQKILTTISLSLLRIWKSFKETCHLHVSCPWQRWWYLLHCQRWTESAASYSPAIPNALWSLYEMILIQGEKDHVKIEEKRIRTRSFFLQVHKQETNNYWTVIRINHTHQVCTCQVYFMYANIMFLIKCLHCHQGYSAHDQQIILLPMHTKHSLFPRQKAFLCSCEEALFSLLAF